MSKQKEVDPLDVIVQAYSAPHPKPSYDVDAIASCLSDDRSKRMMACKACGRAGMLEQFERREGEKMVKAWRCGFCETVSPGVTLKRRAGEVRFTDTRCGGRTTIPFDAISAAYVQGAVESMSQPAQSWALWHYAGSANERHRQASVKAIRKKLDTLCPIDSHEDAGGVDAIVQIYLEAWRTNKQKQIRAATLAKLLGVDQSQFRGGRKWQQIRNIVVSIFEDFDGLVRVTYVTHAGELHRERERRLLAEQQKNTA